MLGIVVVSFGSRALLESNAATIDLAELGARIVVVDNFRSRSSQQAVRELGAERGWDVLDNPTNLGFGAAANLGAAHARRLGCTCLVLLNPDVEITSATLRSLGEQVERTPRTVVTPRILRADGTPWFTGGRIDLRAGRTRNEERRGPVRDGWVTGACLAVHSGLWEEVSGFDEEYFLYWEDVDLSHRCVLAGAELLVRQDLVVLHDVGATQATAGRAKSSAYYYYNCRNRLLFASKHLRRKQLGRWMLRTPGYARMVLLRGGRRQLLRTPRPVFDVARGSIVGAGHALRALVRGRR